MKVKVLFSFAVMAVIFFTGCQSPAHRVYDEAVPPEQRCTVKIHENVTVTSFDGDTVRWSGISQAAGSREGLKGGNAIYSNPFTGYATVEISAGPHKFVADYYKEIRGGSYIQKIKGRDLSFNYRFIAGHTYRIEGSIPNWSEKNHNREGEFWYEGMQRLRIMVKDITPETPDAR